KHLEHRAAGTGGDHDNFGLLQPTQHPACDGARLVPITGVERRLAAASEVVGEIDFVAEALEQVHHTDGRLRVNQVNETRNEQSDRHGGSRWKPSSTWPGTGRLSGFGGMIWIVSRGTLERNPAVEDQFYTGPFRK